MLEDEEPEEVVVVVVLVVVVVVVDEEPDGEPIYRIEFHCDCNVESANLFR